MNHARLIAAVALATSVMTSAESLIAGIVQRLRDGAEDEFFDPDALADELEQESQRLSHAVVANTPASESEALNPAVLAEVQQVAQQDQGGNTTAQQDTNAGQTADQAESAMTSGVGSDQIGDAGSSQTVEQPVTTGEDIAGAEQGGDSIPESEQDPDEAQLPEDDTPPAAA